MSAKFIGALSKAIGYIHDNQSPDYRYPNAASPIPTTEELISEELISEEPLSELGEELDIKIDFE